MGLDSDFLGMLTATVVHESVNVQPDLWGNDAYGPPVTRRCFIESVTGEFGRGVEGQSEETRQVQTLKLICDAVGMKMADRLTSNGTKFYVSAVDTYKDEFGADLYQEVTARDQKE